MNTTLRVNVPDGAFCPDAFARPNGDHYDRADAATANGRTVAFMREHLAA